MELASDKIALVYFFQEIFDLENQRRRIKSSEIMKPLIFIRISENA
jgi:hypothetical protein